MTETEEKRGLLARLIGYMLDNKPDLLFAILRNVRPIFVTPRAAFITRFNDVQEVLSRPDIFNVTYAPMMDPSVGPFMLAGDCTTINQRDRGIMRAMMQQEDLPRVRQVVTQLTAAAIEPLPGDKKGDPAIHARNVQAGQEMQAYMKALLPQRRADSEAGVPLDDTLSRILRSRFVNNINFDDQRIITNIIGTLVGGVETTSAAIVQILDQLFKRPEELHQAIEAATSDDHSTLLQYCREALRFNPVNPFVVRHCSADYRVAAGSMRSTMVKAGTTVLVSTRSAMRDGRQIPAADSFCTDRPHYHYMQLGYGMHTCLGDQLSKVQVPEIIKHILKLPDIRPVGNIDYAGGPFPEKYVLEFD